MKSSDINVIAKLAALDQERGLSGAESEKFAQDLRTGIRAIRIYTNLMQRDIDADPGNIEMQQYCDGINATIQDLTHQLELLGIGTAVS